MGLDGGTKISRSDVLRGQSWKVASQDKSRSTRGGSVTTGPPAVQPADEQQAERVASWTTCSISGEMLHAPIVADARGRLYNKDSVVELLLARKDIFLDGQRSVHQYANRLRTFAGAFDDLQSLKDVFEVQLQPQGNAQQEASTSDGTAAMKPGSQPAPYSCPVTGLSCTRYPFAALKRCGHVLSSRALAATTEGDHACPLCGKAYKAKDVVAMGGSSKQADHGVSCRAGARAEERKRTLQVALAAEDQHKKARPESDASERIKSSAA